MILLLAENSPLSTLRNNYRSQKKIQVVDELRKGKKFAVIALELGIAKATVEVYAIDCFAANAPLGETMLVRNMEVNPESFKLIKGEIEGCKDGKLRTVKNQLNDVFSYNQSCLVLACMICKAETL